MVLLVYARILLFLLLDLKKYKKIQTITNPRNDDDEDDPCDFPSRKSGNELSSSHFGDGKQCCQLEVLIRFSQNGQI